MAVTTQNSTEYGNTVAVPVVFNATSEMHGKVRIANFTCLQVGAGEATSSVALFKLPGGKVRLLMPSFWAYVNWTTASAKLDLGWDAYTGQDGVTVVADPDGLLNALDVDTVGLFSGYNEEFISTVGSGLTALNGYTKVFESRDGVVIRATSQDTAIADGDDLVGHIFYVID
jgi:hypothetical protein